MVVSDPWRCRVTPGTLNKYDITIPEFTSDLGPQIPNNVRSRLFEILILDDSKASMNEVSELLAGGKDDPLYMQCYTMLYWLAETRVALVPRKLYYLPEPTKLDEKGFLFDPTWLEQKTAAQQRICRNAIRALMLFDDERVLPVLDNLLKSEVYCLASAEVYFKLTGIKAVSKAVRILRWGDEAQCERIMQLLVEHPTEEGLKAIELLIQERSGIEVWDGLVKKANRYATELFQKLHPDKIYGM